jgi:hypothetical protein
MNSRTHIKHLTLVLLFTFCQVMGIMCAVPDLSLADDMPQLTGEMSHAACPMDGTIMCPPASTSSPERQIKNETVADVYAPPILVSGATTPVSPSAQPIWSVSLAYFIVPISTASSSVLRI